MKKTTLALILTLQAASAATVPVCFPVEEETIPIVIEAFTETYGYQPILYTYGDLGQQFSEPNPETPQQFTKRKIKEWATDVTNVYYREKAKSESTPSSVVTEDKIGI